MSTEKIVLERECRVFTRFLTRQAPTPYVRRKYVEAHEALVIIAGDPMDRVLVRAAAWSPVMARLTDAYARLVVPRSTLRRKLIVLLAILEVSPPFHRTVDVVRARSSVLALIGLAVSGVIGVLAAFAGVLVFAPVHVAVRICRGSQ